jgi:murein endopeptidase
MTRFGVILPAGLVALTAAWLGAHLGAGRGSGTALAETAADTNSGGRLGVAMTAAAENNGNRLIVLDTVKKKLLVYAIYDGRMRLIAARTYDLDMEWGLTPDARGAGFSYRDAERAVDALRVMRKRANPNYNWAPVGREMIVSGDAANNGAANRIVLVNPEMKLIMVYRLDGASLWLAAVRPFDRDMMLLYTDQLQGDGLTYEAVDRLIVESERRNALPPGGARGR